MFAIIKSNQFVQFLPEGTPFKLDGVQYPQNWLNLSTPQEKARLGIVDVVYGQRADDRYYWVSEDAPVVEGGVVKVNYTNTPKDLFECQNQAVSAINAAAYSILLPSDWMVVKAMETGVAVEVNWAAWRQEIRDQAAAQVDAITACKDIDSLAALAPVQWPHDPNFIESSI
jgi:hypothetical protein